MKKLILVLAVVLPVLLPVSAVSKMMLERSIAPIYKIKITGYDPRDMLYGHFLRHRFVEEDIIAQGLSKEVSDNIRSLDRRYYIPEAEARRLDRILRGRKLDMHIGVGVMPNGKVFKDQLYIEGRTMEEFLRSSNFKKSNKNNKATVRPVF